MTALPLAVRVPASTSNLGPGFDLLGMALGLYLDVEIAEPPAAPSAARRAGGRPALVEARGEARGWPEAGELVQAALALGAARMGLELGALGLRARSEVPPERGLGSSGAAVVAGLCLARALSPAAPTDAELLAWAFELEGHPDNVTPALLGGCTLSLPDSSGLIAIRQPVHPSLRIALAWPDLRLPTRAARAVLPESVPFADAIENPRRLACLLEGLRSGDPLLLALGGEDRLHVPHRLALVPGAARALAAAREAGAWLATLSGSGSALVALSDEDHVEPVAEAMRGELARENAAAVARVVALETRGARIVHGRLEDLDRDPPDAR